MRYVISTTRLLLAWGAVGVALAGCNVTAGTYTLTAVRADGTPMSNAQATAHGAGIYGVRNAICSAEPGATVFIRDAATGQEVPGESPYRCVGR